MSDPFTTSSQTIGGNTTSGLDKVASVLFNLSNEFPVTDADYGFFPFATFAAQVVRGITGFGTSITFICIWTVASGLLGIGTHGGLRRVVCCDAIVSGATTAWMAYVIDMKKHLDWSLVIPVLPWCIASAPLGVFLLRVLPKQHVEILAGSVLLFTAIKNTVDAACSKTRSGTPPPAPASSHDVDNKDEHGAATGGPRMVEEDIELDLLLPTNESSLPSSMGSSQQAAGEGEAMVGRDMALWVKVLLSMVVGVVSGILSGASGMGGPPIIIWLQYLQTPKMQVRAFNAATGLIGAHIPRLFTYIHYGMLYRNEVWLYGINLAAGGAGVVVGNMVSGRLDERTFNHALTAVIALGGALLLARGFGLTM